MNNTDAQNKAIHAGAKKIKVSVAAQPHEIGHIIEDHKGNILERHEGEGRFSLGAKTKALKVIKGMKKHPASDFNDRDYGK